MRGEAEKRRYLEATCGDGLYFALTDGRWKYIFYPEGGHEQLFDLQADPDETRNLALQNTHNAKRSELRHEMTRRHEARGSSALANGRLLEKPLRGDRESDRRNRSWPGYHTEYFDSDVRH